VLASVREGPNPKAEGRRKSEGRNETSAIMAKMTAQRASEGTQSQDQRKTASALEPCAQPEFQSAV
jgi:hypothetical protein